MTVSASVRRVFVQKPCSARDTASRFCNSCVSSPIRHYPKTLVTHWFRLVRARFSRAAGTHDACHDMQGQRSMHRVCNPPGPAKRSMSERYGVLRPRRVPQPSSSSTARSPTPRIRRGAGIGAERVPSTPRARSSSRSGRRMPGRASRSIAATTLSARAHADWPHGDRRTRRARSSGGRAGLGCCGDLSQRVSMLPCGRTTLVSTGLVSFLLSVPISAGSV
jgi:hypothetical protein